MQRLVHIPDGRIWAPLLRTYYALMPAYRLRIIPTATLTGMGHLDAIQQLFSEHIVHCQAWPQDWYTQEDSRDGTYAQASFPQPFQSSTFLHFGIATLFDSCRNGPAGWQRGGSSETQHLDPTQSWRCQRISTCHGDAAAQESATRVIRGWRRGSLRLVAGGGREAAQDGAWVVARLRNHGKTCLDAHEPPVDPKAARDGGLHGLAKVGGCSRVSAWEAKAATSCQDQGVAS